jgi:hypothetical protein
MELNHGLGLILLTWDDGLAFGGCIVGDKAEGDSPKAEAGEIARRLHDTAQPGWGSGSAESWADLGQGAQAGHHQRKVGRKEKSRRVWRSEMCGGGLATGAVAARWDWSGGCMMQDQERQRLWFPVRAVGWWRAAIWRRAQVTGRNRLGRFWGDCGELCNEAYPGSRTCHLKEELL